MLSHQRRAHSMHIKCESQQCIGKMWTSTEQEKTQGALRSEESHESEDVLKTVDVCH